MSSTYEPYQRSVFVVKGKPVGYTRMTQAGKYNSYVEKYHDYKKLVQIAASHASVAVPLFSTEEGPVKIDTETCESNYCFL